jgi:hypothetical protein
MIAYERLHDNGERGWRRNGDHAYKQAWKVRADFDSRMYTHPNIVIALVKCSALIEPLIIPSHVIHKAI